VRKPKNNPLSPKKVYRENEYAAGIATITERLTLINT
jgi:hypothetical protein